MNQKKVGIACAVIGIITVIAVIAVMMPHGNNKTTTAITPTSIPQVTQGIVKPAVSSTSTVLSTEIDDDDVVIVDNEYITAVYEKRYDNELMEGFGYLVINLTNHTDKTITVMTTKASINDEMLSTPSGCLWDDVEPNKSKRQTFNIFFNLLNTNSVSEIEKIKFNMTIRDDKFNEVAEIENIEIDF